MFRPGWIVIALPVAYGLALVAVESCPAQYHVFNEDVAKTWGGLIFCLFAWRLPTECARQSRLSHPVLPARAL